MSSQLDKQTKPIIDKRWEKIEEEFEKKFVYRDNPNSLGVWDFTEKYGGGPDDILSFFKSKLSLLEKENEKLKDALIWCSGSEDFNEGGKARKGWLEICVPLLKLQSLKRRKK